MENPICKKVEEHIEKFENGTLDSAPPYATTQKKIIELIDSYWVSKYRDNQYDELGFLKPFYNIVINPTEVAAKMVDLDTKDIRIVAEDGQSYYPAWLFGKELKIWMKDNKIGKLLNQIVLNAPKYGSIVLKKVGNEINLVPIQNIVCNPTAKRLTDDLIVEVHEETTERFMQMVEEYGWDKDQAGGATGDDTIIFYEVYGQVDDYAENYFIVTKNGIMLYADKRDCPYKEFHWDKIDGRWFGVGQVERLFEAQIQINKIEKYKSNALHWTSKRIWQTRDDTIKKNLMTDIKNGDLLFVNSEINPVSTEERNLHAYRDEDARWDKLRQEITFAYDTIRGERPPSGTPLGSAILQTRMAGGFFDFKREELGLFLKGVILDWVIPQFAKEKKGEHIVTFGEFKEDELTKLKNLIITNRTNKEIINKLIAKGKVPSAQEYELLRSAVKEKINKEKELKIPKGYYDNLKYKIDVIVTNEQVDVASKMTTLQTILTIIGSNPTILQDPRTKKVFYQMLDLAGISPTDFEGEVPEIEQQAEQVAQRGGGMAKVSPMSAPASGVNTTTL